MDDTQVREAIEAQYKDDAVYSYMFAETLTQSIYETHAGIYNHMSPNFNPLASVALHPSERYFESSGLYNTIKKYTERGIKDRYGLNLMEYLNLPREIHRMLSARGIEMIAESKRAQQQAEIEARKQQGGSMIN